MSLSKVLIALSFLRSYWLGLQVLGPKRRLNMSLLMSIPTLADDSISSSSGSGTSSPSQAHSILREALLLSVCCTAQSVRSSLVP